MTKVNMKELIKQSDYIYAHKEELVSGKRFETLIEHSERAFSIYTSIKKENDVEEVLDRILNDVKWTYKGKESKFSLDTKALIRVFFDNVIYLHDIGKINPQFQEVKMDNPRNHSSPIPNLTVLESKHSFLSTAIYLDTFYPHTKKIPDKIERAMAQYFLLSLSFIIYTHHENLYDFDNWTEHLKTKVFTPIQNNPSYLYFYKGEQQSILKLAEISSLVDWINKRVQWDGTCLYILSKLSQSLLITSDYVSTHQFFQNQSSIDFSFGNIKKPKEIVKAYEESDIFKGIQAQRKDPTHFATQPINVLREQMFTEAETQLQAHMNHQLFNLEMPTGSGKTNTSLNLALRCLENGVSKKVFYVFPFNTLSDQSVFSIKNYIQDKVEVEVINSVTPGLSRFDENGMMDYKQSLLDRQMLNYPFVLTSHVNLFQILFGTGRESSMPLFQLCNSVIILDEIQSYRNAIWREMIELLYRYAKWLNIKIVVMSATLPNLQKLIGFDNEPFVSLIKEPKKYYENPLFKERVNIDQSLVNEWMTEQKLKQEVEKAIEKREKVQQSIGRTRHSKVLVQFIKKETAKEFYRYLQKQLDTSVYKLFLLTGDDHKGERQEVIRYITESTNEHVILVTTQLIEAGVDIDMDIGFKDKSLLDNEEQFLGRINRNSKKENCVAYFVNWDKEKNIYREDLRLGAIQNNQDYFHLLQEKEFDSYYLVAFERIRLQKELLNRNNIEFFYKELRNLRFQVIADHMKLINENTFQIFLPYSVKIQTKTGITELNGEKIWKEYLALLQNNRMEYAKRRMEMLKIREKLQYFTFSLYGNGIEGEESVGGFFYIQNGKQFMESNKFNSSLFKESFPINQ